jgi:hypothetical protein
VKALLLTREYPPHIYGGAGVVVGQLRRSARPAHACRGPLLRRSAPRRVDRTRDPARLHAWERVGAAKDEPRYAPVARDALDRARRWRATRSTPSRATRTPGTRTWPGFWIRTLHRIPLVRHPAQHGAAPALEGGSARQRLSALELDREDRGGGGRPGHRGLAQDARRHPRALPGRSRNASS